MCNEEDMLDKPVFKKQKQQNIINLELNSIKILTKQKERFHLIFKTALLQYTIILSVIQPAKLPNENNKTAFYEEIFILFLSSFA